MALEASRKFALSSLNVHLLDLSAHALDGVLHQNLVVAKLEGKVGILLPELSVLFTGFLEVTVQVPLL